MSDKTVLRLAIPNFLGVTRKFGNMTSITHFRRI